VKCSFFCSFFFKSLYCLPSDPRTTPPRIRKVLDLLLECERVLKNGTRKEVQLILGDLTDAIVKEFNSTAVELFAFAEQLRYSTKRYLRSIAIFGTAIVASRRETDKEKVLQEAEMSAIDLFLADKTDGGGLKIVQRYWTIARGLCGASVSMVAENGEAKSTVQLHVIPLMRDVKDDMEKTACKDESKCMLVAWVIGFIASCEGLVGDHDAEVGTHKQVIQRVKKTHNLDEVAWSMFSTILEDLGEQYKTVTAFGNAATTYRKVGEVYKSISEVDDSVREKLITDCDEMIRMCIRA